MKDKTIYVISDLHIGDGGKRDNFAVDNRRSEFLGFLDYVKKNKGKLMILGDLFEFWQSSLSQVIVKNEDLLDKMANLKATYIIGNHDADLGAFIKRKMLKHPFFNRMSGPIVCKIGGKKFKFQHGHEVDPFNSGDSPSWGRILTIFAGIFEDENGSPMFPSGETVEETLEKFGEVLLQLWNMLKGRLSSDTKGNSAVPKPKEELTPAQNPNRIYELLENYSDNREREGYDIAIVGHTHQAGKLEDEDWYFNSGSWVKKKNEFLTISPNGEIQFYQWSKNKTQHCKPVIKRVEER